MPCVSSPSDPPVRAPAAGWRIISKGTALQRELAQLRTWYDLAVTRRGRTTVGVSRLTPEEMGTFVGAFLDGQVPPNPRVDVPLAALFRYAVEDLKAYY